MKLENLTKLEQGNALVKQFDRITLEAAIAQLKEKHPKDYACLEGFCNELPLQEIANQVGNPPEGSHYGKEYAAQHIRTGLSRLNGIAKRIQAS